MKTKIKERLLFLINERHAGVKKGMANALGIQSASISDWTKNVPKCAPADEHINKICDYYHVSKGWLLGLSEEMQPKNKLKEEFIPVLTHEQSIDDIVGTMTLRDKLIEARTEARILRETLGRDIKDIGETIHQSIQKHDEKTNESFNRMISAIDKLVSNLEPKHYNYPKENGGDARKNENSKLKNPHASPL